MTEHNVLGGELEVCGTEPMTGWYRAWCCYTGAEDRGSHTVCLVLTKEFLTHQRSIGNDLSTPMPQYARFPGLVPGDRWCVTAANWLRAQPTTERQHRWSSPPPTNEPSTSFRSMCCASTRWMFPMTLAGSGAHGLFPLPVTRYPFAVERSNALLPIAEATEGGRLRRGGPRPPTIAEAALWRRHLNQIL